MKLNTKKPLKQRIPARVDARVIHEARLLSDHIGVFLCDYVQYAIEKENKRQIKMIKKGKK